MSTIDLEKRKKEILRQKGSFSQFSSTRNKSVDQKTYDKEEDDEKYLISKKNTEEKTSSGPIKTEARAHVKQNAGSHFMSTTKANNRIHTIGTAGYADKYKHSSYSDIWKAAMETTDSNEKSWLLTYAADKDYDYAEDYEENLSFIEKRLNGLYTARNQIINSPSYVPSAKNTQEYQVNQKRIADMNEEIRSLESAKDSMQNGSLLAARKGKIDNYSSGIDPYQMETVLSRPDIVNPTKDELDKDLWGRTAKYTDSDSIPDKLGLYLDAKKNGYSSEGLNDIGGAWADILREGEGSSWEELEDNEKSVYYYYLKNGQKEKAYQYLSDMSYELGRRADQSFRDEYNDSNTLKKIAYNMASVPENVIGGTVAFVDDAINILSGQEINPYDKYHRAQNQAQAIREETGKDIQEGIGGNLGTFVGNTYQGAMSMLDSIYGAGMLGGAYTVTMGMGAASSRAKELYDQGASNSQIVTGSVISGAIEWITEMLSYDAIVNLVSEQPGLFKKILGGALGAVNEGVEEVNADLLNIVADSLVNGMNSQNEQDARQIMLDTGVTYEKSKREVYAMNAVNSFWSFYGGLISGAGMSVLQGGIDTVRTKENDFQAGENLSFYGHEQDILDTVAKSGDKQLQYLAKKVIEQQSEAYTGKLTDQHYTNLGKLFRLATEKGIIKETEQKSILSDIDNNQRAKVQKNDAYSVGKSDYTVSDEINIPEVQGGVKTDQKESSYDIAMKRLTSGEVTQESEDTTSPPVVEQEEVTPVEDSVKETVTEEDDSRSPDALKGALSSVDMKKEDVSKPILNFMESEYDGSIPANAFVRGYLDGYNYGKIGWDRDLIPANSLFRSLSEAQQNHAYELGTQAKDSLAKKTGETFIERNNGKIGGVIIGSGVSLDELKKTFNDVQNVSYQLISSYAQASGVNIIFERSEIGKDGRYHLIDSNGRDYNAKYDPKENAIHIDINAGLVREKDIYSLGKYTMIRSFSHDFTHFLEKAAPEEYNNFRSFIIRYLTNNGTDVDDLIETDMDKHPGMTKDAASREVIGECMTDMVLDSTIQEAAKENPKWYQLLIQKLKEFISKLKDLAKKLVPNTYRGANALKTEINNEIHYAESVLGAWQKIVNAAYENSQKLRAKETVEESSSAPALPSPAVWENASLEKQKPKLSVPVMAETETKVEASNNTEESEEVPSFTGQEKSLYNVLVSAQYSNVNHIVNGFEYEIIKNNDTYSGAIYHTTSAPIPIRNGRAVYTEDNTSLEELAANMVLTARNNNLLEAINKTEENNNGGLEVRKSRFSRKTTREDNGGTVPAVDTDRSGDARLLGEVQAEDVQGNGGGRDTSGDLAERRGTTERRDRGNDTTDRSGGSSGDREVGVQGRHDVTPEETEAKDEEIQSVAENQEKQQSTVNPKGNNFVIGESLDLPNGEKARFKANIDAIRLVKKLIAEGRYATPDEQIVLSKYVGWGGLSNAFGSPRYNRETRQMETVAIKGWENELSELQSLLSEGILTQKEYEEASASTKNAHYTSVDVIRAMYDGLKYIGFTGGRMLEPSSGVGNFVGAMPSDMTGTVKSWTMVELDSITGNIAKYLYPNADVRIQGFETANIPDNYMDVAIGNVPFGNYGVVDSTYPKRITKSIHNYFFAKSIDKVRPGGIVMFITSSFTMNGRDTTIRQYIMDRADLIGAIRLPNKTFAGNAGTEVFTDILILKKRSPGTEYAGEAFLESPYRRIGENSYVGANINEYFDNHPEMALGTPAIARGMYSSESLTYTPIEGKPLDQQIKDAFKNIQEKMDYKAPVTPEKANFEASRRAKKTKKSGYEVKNDGKVFKNVDGKLEEITNAESAKRVIGILDIKKAYRTLIDYIQQGQAENLIKSARSVFNKAYDDFVKKYGYLNSVKNRSAINDDPDSYSILSLENYNKDSGAYKKADIFSKDTVKPNKTITHVEDIQTGVIVSINRTGTVDINLIAKLTDKTPEKVTRELIDGRMAFKDRDGNLVPPDKYLSGNVRAKLKEAEALAPIDSDYQNNVEELKRIIPKDVPYTDIYVTPGSPWIPNEVYADFIAHMLGGYNRVSDYTSPDVVVEKMLDGTYKIILNNKRLKERYQNTQEWGTESRTFINIIENMMNSSSLTVYDTFTDDYGKEHKIVNKDASKAVQEKAGKIKEAFEKWLWNDEARRNVLSSLYNETFNNIVNPKFSGENLTINGLNAEFTLRPHQSDAVQRIISSGGNTLLAHRVGAGKTLEMASAAMKLRELGIVRKPVFVAPKSLVAQWGTEFIKYFPAAKLMVSDEKSFTKENRMISTNRIANGDYDAIIISYEQFEKIPMSKEWCESFYQDQINEIIAAIAEEKAESGDKRFTVKDMEKKKVQLEKKIAELNTKEKDEDNITFEELGIDSIFVDEAHNFKNLQYITRMTNVSGLGDTKGSQRAFDLYTKIRYLQGLNGGRGVVFATATPVMNSMSEMYIMQKYLQPDKLDQLGLRSFDAWARQFGEVRNELEVKPSGQGYQIKQSFSHFKNLNELQLLFRSFSDVVTDVPGLKIPKMKGGKVKIVECESGQFQKDYMIDLEKRANNIKNVDPKDDNMLKITVDARKISYTQRMIDPSLPYEEGCKIFRCCENILQEYKESSKIKGTQIVFCDIAPPKAKKDSKSVEPEDDIEVGIDEESARLYEDMKAYLIKKGIPSKEIAFIHDAKKNKQRTQLFEDVSEGRVRVLIGSTGKMGVGMNVQKRIVAIHHIDAPYRPGDIEQRDGRAFRQGNMNEEVSKYVYVTKGSGDSYLWNKLDRKNNFIKQIMNGEDIGRTVEDAGDVTLSAAEISAASSGNPLFKDRYDFEKKVSDLESLKKAHISAVLIAQAKLRKDITDIASLENNISSLKEDMRTRKSTYTDDNFSMKVGTKTYTDKKEAGEALMESIKSKASREFVTVGSFAGFDMRVVKEGTEYAGLLSGKNGYPFKVYTMSTTRMINQICSVVSEFEKRLSLWESNLSELRADLKAQEKMIDEPFERQADLDNARNHYNEIIAKLSKTDEQYGGEEIQYHDKYEDDRYEDSRDAELLGRIRAYGRDDLLRQSRENTEEIFELLGIRQEKVPNNDRPRVGSEGWFRECLPSESARYVKSSFRDLSRKGIKSYDSAGRIIPEPIKKILSNTIVKNPDGTLLSLFHWTNSKFSIFRIGDIGFHFGTLKAANYIRTVKEVDRKKSFFKEIYCLAENPLIVTDHSSWNADILAMDNIISKEEAKSIVAKDKFGFENQLGYDSVANNELRNILKDHGYDSIIYINNFEDGISLMVFDDNQIITVSENGIPVDDVQYQDRTESLSDHEVLSMAANSLDQSSFTPQEKAALEIAIKKIDELNDTIDKRIELGRLYREQQFGENVDRAAAAQTHTNMETLDNKIKRMDNDLLSMEEKEVLKGILKKSRKIIEAEDRRKSDERLKRWRDRRNNADAIRKYRTRLETDIAELSNWITHPDNKNAIKHIPDALKNSVKDLIFSIDLSSKRSLNGGAQTVKDREIADRLKSLNKAIKSDLNHEEMYADYDLPEDFIKTLDSLIDKIETYLYNNSGTYTVNEMTSDELRDISKVVRNVKKMITGFNSFHNNAIYQHVYEAGENSMVTLRGMSNAGNTGVFSNYMLWQTMLPAYAFERFGTGGISILKEFEQGQAKMAFNAREIIDFANGAYTSREITEWKKQVKTFYLRSDNGDGTDEVRIPVTWLMSIYELYKQPDSVRHMINGGIRISTHKDGSKKISDVGHVVTIEDLKEMLSDENLTPRQKEVADKLQNFMATVGAKWGNHVTRARFGEEQFTNPLYFPINSDGRHLDSNVEESPKNASLYALLNMGFTIQRQEKANNRIVIYDIFDVFANHMASMAQYNAMALPVLDAIKWLNYKEYDVSGRKVVCRLKDELSRVYGVPDEMRPGSGTEGYAVTFIKNIIKAYNGTESHSNQGDDPVLALISRQNMAKIAFVARVATLQPLSIIRAGMVINYGDIVKGMHLSPAELKRDRAELMKYSGIAVWKDLGFYDTNISRGLTSLIKHDETIADRAKDVGMAAAEKADDITWVAIWNACKHSVKRSAHESDEEYFKAVANLFDDVVYKTQVVDSVLTRVEYMRSKAFVPRVMSAFRSEGVRVSNMVTDAVERYDRDRRKGYSRQEAWKRNRGKITRVLFVYCLESLVLSALESAWDAYRDDEDDESFWEKFKGAFLGNLIDELAPFKLPIFSTFYDAVKALLSAVGVDTYGSDPPSMIGQVYEYLRDFIVRAQDYMTGNTKFTMYGVVYKLLQTVSALSGIAFSSVTREAIDLWNNTAGAIDYHLKVKQYDNKMRDTLDSLEKGDIDKAKQFIQDVKNEYASEGKTEEDARKAIQSRLTSEWKQRYLNAGANDRKKIRDMLDDLDIYKDIDKTIENWLKDEEE